MYILSEQFETTLTGTSGEITSSGEPKLQINFTLGAKEHIKLLPVRFNVENDQVPVEYISKYYRHNKPEERIAKFMARLLNLKFRNN